MGPAVADEADPGLEGPATGKTEVCCLDCCMMYYYVMNTVKR